jgi:hypothetical protein
MTPTHERIQKRAYELYLLRGGENGLALNDWLTAEMEMIPPPVLPRLLHDLDDYVASLISE